MAANKLLGLLKKGTCTALTLAMVLGCAEYAQRCENSFLPGNINVVYAAQEIDGHKYVVSNSGYNLYVSEEDLSLVIEDKTTGATLESYPTYDDGQSNATWYGAMHSAVVMTLISANDDTKQADLINDDVTKTITYTDTGFSAELYWNTYKLGMTLEVSFTDEGLTTRIAEDSIREDGESYYIGTVSMYPYMGTSYLDDNEGYMFIPDGNGALVYLDDKEGRFSSGYSALIYGEDIGFDESEVNTLLLDRYNTITDPQQILAPVFGIAHTDDQIAFLGIVEDGAQRADINVMPNGVSVNYNRSYARFILRKLYTQPTSNNSTSGSLHVYEADRSHSDLQVRFKFLSGSDATYSGMASSYRDYLLDGGMLTKQDVSYNTRVDFLGTERESWLLGTSAVVMTTTDDIREIYDDLEGSGVTTLMSVYKGWQAGGLYDLPITKYKADGKIGGTSDLTKLIQEAEADGINLYLYDDALIINPDEQNATFNVVKKVNKRRYEYETYKDVYDTFLYITPSRADTVLNKVLNSYSKEGVNNLAVAGISNTMYTYTYSGTKYTRFDTAASYKSTIETLYGSSDLVLETPIASYWANTKAFLDMPLYSSSYILEDVEIPFLSIVLTGIMPVYAEYVNFEANKNEFFLKMIESGAFPSFYITKESSSELINTNSCDIYSSEYSSFKDTIIAYDKEFKALHEKTQDAVIVNHELLDNSVTRVTYSNGVVIYINYGESSQTVDGITIDTMSYEVAE
ncbi:MAG: hypothetical protein K6G87_10725 [Butyrivibrio sp.]|uniref:DUF5696 domain-containing protein n=1 Tax=Butyrivibrio sp. TaxID=28121 RepID=UPI0025D6224A|nr:DUF5696 domain-containing protein [Butyrivibrio sp.]MCR5771685.1 hypothetical protein [Butyrivibrio sp.]